MAGNTVSIGFDYRKQLDKAVKDIENTVNKALGSGTYGKEFEKQIDSFKDMLSELKESLNDSFKGLATGKLDTDKFDAFRVKVTKDFQRVDGEIESLNKSIKTLNDLLGVSGEGVDLSNAINQFKELQDFINANNDAVTKLLKTLKKTDTAIVFDQKSFSVDEAKSKIQSLNDLLDGLDKDINFKGLNSKELKTQFDQLYDELDNLLEKRGDLEDQLQNTNKSDPMFYNLKSELSETELRLSRVAEEIGDIYDLAHNQKKLSWAKNLDIFDLNNIVDEMDDIQQRAKDTIKELQSYAESIYSSAAKVSNKINPNTSELGIQVRISTRDKTLRDELIEKINKLQSHLNMNPLILPIKMVVSNARTTSDNPLKTSTDAIKKAQKALQDETSNVQMETDDLPKQTLKQALINAEKAAKESQKRIQEVFDAVPIQVHFEVPTSEIEKVSRAILDNNGETKVDISGQIDKTIQRVDTLMVKLKDVDKQVYEAKTNNKFKGLSEEIKKSLSDLSSLKDILNSIKDLEATIARGMNVSTSDDITRQWNNVKFWFDYISDENKSLDFTKQTKQIAKLMEEYQKYVNMGGKNPLRNLTNDKNTIENLYSQYKEFSTLIKETNKSTTESKIDTKKVEEKLPKQEIPATIKVKPSINPREFANDVTKQLADYKAQINVEPKVRDKTLFNSNREKGDQAAMEQMSQVAKEAAGNLHLVTDELGNVKVFYRGLRESMGQGLVSDRFNGATFWTDSFDLAKEYSNWTKVESAHLSMLKPLEIQGNGANWNNIEYLGTGIDEASKKIIAAKNKMLEDLGDMQKYAEQEGYHFKDITSEYGMSEFRRYMSEVWLDVEGFPNEVKEEMQHIKDKVEEGWSEYQAISLDKANVYGRHNTKEFVELAQNSGQYDGVIFKNIIDSASGVVRDATNVVVQFNEDKIKFIETLKASDNLNERDITAITQTYSVLARRIDEINQKGRTKIGSYDSDVEKAELQEELNLYEQILPILSEYKDRLIEIHNAKIDEDNIVIPQDKQDKLKNKILSSLKSLYGKKDTLTVEDVEDEFKWNQWERTEKSAPLFDVLKKESTTTKDLLLLTDQLYEQEFKRFQINAEIIKQKKQQIGDLSKDIFAQYNISNEAQKSTEQTEHFIEQATEQLFQQEAPITINVNPILNPQEFANKVTEQLTGYNAQIGVEPKVNNNKGKKKKTQIKPINTEQSTKEIQNENNAFDQIDKSAKKAAKSKEAFKKSNESLAVGAEKSAEIINEESNALSNIENSVSTIHLDRNSEEFQNAAKSARQYFNELGEIASITRTSGTYNTYNKHTGKTEQFLKTSYRITDVNGNSRTIDPQGNLIGSKDVVNVTASYKEYLKIQEEIYELSLKEAKGQQLTEEELSRRVKLTNDLNKQSEILFDLEQKGLENAEMRDEILRRNQSYEQTLIDTKIKSLVSNPVKGFEERISKLDTNKNLSKQTDEYRNRLEEIKNLINELKTYENGGLSLFDSDTENRIEGITEQIKTMFSTLSDMDKAANQAKATSLISNIEDYIAKNSSLSMTSKGRGFIADLRELQGELKNADLTSPGLQDIVVKFNKIKTAITEAGLAGRSFFDVIKSKAFYMAAETLARLFSINDIIRYGRTVFNTIRELDTALVDLRKTAKMSTSELDDFYKASNDVAKQMGVTTKEIINQAAAWSRLGYSTADEAEKMAALSSKFAAVSPDMDVSQATDGLVSSMKAFRIEVDNVERDVMDNINRIGNTMATTNGEIVDMLTRSSAAMSAANNTIQETIALESAAVEITRNAETTGTAFKTVAMRIRGYDEETEELSEDLENIAGDIADLTKINGKGGISLFTDKDKQTYKSTYQILKEIAGIWDQLSDKNQAQLLEKISGKRGAQVVAGVISNFSAAEKAMNEMTNAAGSADAEMSIIESSIDYKINKFKETWVGVAQELIDRGDIGKIVDGFTAISEAIALITKNIGLLGTVGAVGGGILGAKNLGRSKKFLLTNMPRLTSFYPVMEFLS